MTELETKIWNIVHNWCDGQSSEIPDQNRRYLMDEIKALFLSHVSKSLPSSETAYSEQLFCRDCKYDKAETYHDKMWCRDCRQKDRFTAK